MSSVLASQSLHIHVRSERCGGRYSNAERQCGASKLEKFRARFNRTPTPSEAELPEEEWQYLEGDEDEWEDEKPGAHDSLEQASGSYSHTTC